MVFGFGGQKGRAGGDHRSKQEHKMTFGRVWTENHKSRVTIFFKHPRANPDRFQTVESCAAAIPIMLLQKAITHLSASIAAAVPKGDKPGFGETNVS